MEERAAARDEQCLALRFARAVQTWRRMTLAPLPALRGRTESEQIEGLEVRVRELLSGAAAAGLCPYAPVDGPAADGGRGAKRTGDP